MKLNTIHAVMRAYASDAALQERQEACGMGRADASHVASPTNHPGLPSLSSGWMTEARVVLLLRWVLIIATSYLVVFSRPLGQSSTSTGLFIAVYFTSNILLTEWLPRFRSQYAFDLSVVLFDVVMVSIGLALTPSVSTGFYVVYFLVIFLSALTERLTLAVMAALLISGAHLYTEARFVGWNTLMTPAYMLRPPFLFVVAMFFGNLVQDARSRERSAEESRARARRMDFLSAVSHDLKNPLGVVQSLATMLLDGEAGPLKEQQSDLVRRIHASTRHVITLAFNLIDAARIDAGQLTLQKRDADIRILVDDALLLARSAAELKGLTLQWSLPPDLPLLRLDRVQMERVVSNLVGNAIKFTPTGGTITLSAEHRLSHILLMVCDDGPGMPQNEALNVFEKYRRQTRDGSIDGSGLGLFIVKAIVEAHGGTVHLESRIGHGTTVTVQLPVTAPDAREARAARVPATRWFVRLLRIRPHPSQRTTLPTSSPPQAS